MYHYRLRVDAVGAVSDESLGVFLRKNSSRFICVAHVLPTGNPHYHVYLICDKKIDALRLGVKRFFNLEKRGMYSLKDCDELRVDEYVQYLFNTKHGNQWRIVEFRDLDYDNYLTPLIARAKTISEEFVSKKSSRATPTLYDLGVEVSELYAAKVNDARRVELEIYTDLAIQVCNKYRKGYDFYVLRKIIITAMGYGDEGRTFIRSKILSMFNT